MWGPVGIFLKKALAKAATAVGGTESEDTVMEKLNQFPDLEEMIMKSSIAGYKPQPLKEHIKHFTIVPGEGQDFALKGKFAGIDIGDAEGPGGYRVIPNPARFIPEIGKYWDMAKEAALTPLNTEAVGEVGTDAAGQNYEGFVNSAPMDFTPIVEAAKIAAKYTAMAAEAVGEAALSGATAGAKAVYPILTSAGVAAKDAAIDYGKGVLTDAGKEAERAGTLAGYLADAASPYVEAGLDHVQRGAVKAYSFLGDAVLEHIKQGAIVAGAMRDGYRYAKNNTQLEFTRIETPTTEVPDGQPKDTVIGEGNTNPPEPQPTEATAESILATPTSSTRAPTGWATAEYA